MYRRSSFPLLPVPVLLAALLLSVTAAAQRPRLSATTGNIGGVVADNQSQPIANAVVQVLSGPMFGETRTDATGRYTLADLLPGTYELVAFKIGYEPADQSGLAVTEGQATTVNFTTKWADSATGGVEISVVDASRNPLADSTVDLQSFGTFVDRVPTDSTGSSIFVGLAPGIYSAAVRRPGFLDATVPNFGVRAGGLTRVTVQLRRDTNSVGRLGGVVRSTDGTLVANATVSIIAGLTLKSTQTTSAGQDQFTGLVPSANYAIQIQAFGFATQTLGGITVLPLQRTSRDVFLVKNVAGKGSLEGNVRDANGRAIALATVTIAAGPALALGHQAATGPDGRYVFTGLPSSNAYAVVVEQSGFAPVGRSSITVTAGQTTILDLTLSVELTPPGSVSGTVREAGSGLLLANVVVEVIQGRSAGLAATTDGAGNYEITGIAPDSYTLRFSKDGYEAFTTTPFQVVSATNSQVDVQLTPRHVSTGQIGGHVTAVVGGPVTGATVTLFAGPSSPLKTTTDANGAYLFQNLRPGSGYALRVEQQGFIATELRNISLTDGQSLNVDVALKLGNALGKIKGTVMNLIQQPIHGAFVQVVAGPVIPAGVRTDENGEFLIEKLPRGSYTLEASANGFRTTRQPLVNVSPQHTARVTINLLP